MIAAIILALPVSMGTELIYGRNFTFEQLDKCIRWRCPFYHNTWVPAYNRDERFLSQCVCTTWEEK